MQFKDKLRFHKAIVKTKGIFSAPTIPYEVRIPSGDSSPFFGNYVGQKYGAFDTDTCWDFSMCEVMETQLAVERSLGRFSQEDLDWFKANGYIDEDGDFYLSRRWAAILSGVKDNGNDGALAWKLAARVGMIPFSMLPFSISDIQNITNRQDFVNKYFDPVAITPAMEAMGKEFLKRVNIQSEELGDRWTVRTPEVIQKALKQGSLQIGIPVPQDGSWNQTDITYPGTTNPQHAVEMYMYTLNNPFPNNIYDSYQPNLKALSSNYYIPLILRGVLTAKNPMLSTTISFTVWEQFVTLLRKLGIISN